MDQHETRQWEDDRFYSSHSDDSPILHRYDRPRRYSYEASEAPEREKRYTLTVVAKFFLFCTAMILFCVLMYIPVYSKANYQVPKSIVAGWPVHISRDTKIYVQPNNITTIHEPKRVCPKQYGSKEKLFLLIIVCSSTVNFDRRIAIRETWRNYINYLNNSKVFNQVRERYKEYNYTYDLYKDLNVSTFSNVTVIDVDNVKDGSSVAENRVASSLRDNVARKKRDISIGRLLPALAKALKNNIERESLEKEIKTEKTEERRFDDDDDPMLPEFSMNDALGGQEDLNYDYNYDTNVMRIPPRGFEESPDLGKILSLLKQSKSFKENSESLFRTGNTEPDFKLVFLLGLPAQENDTETQRKIEEEVKKYGDVIQEDFVDSYNNLTLKSIMMLKWVTNKCNNSVRYILKTDDDMYINVPNLMLNLRNRSSVFDKKHNKKPATEYLLIGDLICGARPVLDAHNKWYSPRYMYNGKIYPCYLSGTGYVFSTPTARALYEAALNTNYFHLEDVFITGICPLHSWPRIPPRDDPLFSYRGGTEPCTSHALVTAHRVAPTNMRVLDTALRNVDEVDKCERIRLTQIKRDREGVPLIYYITILFLLILIFLLLFRNFRPNLFKITYLYILHALKFSWHRPYRKKNIMLLEPSPEIV